MPHCMVVEMTRFRESMIRHYGRKFALLITCVHHGVSLKQMDQNGLSFQMRLSLLNKLIKNADNLNFPC